jgi:hypothetical protein
LADPTSAKPFETLCRGGGRFSADHNAYHTGELAIMRQVMGIWPVGREYLTGEAD